MTGNSHFLAMLYSLAAMLVWGGSDFIGGYASRRANAFSFTTLVHACAVLFMGGIAWLARSPFPDAHARGWALAAGTVGGLALAIFYRALAAGKMGLVAPIAAVLGAGIPTLFSLRAEGFPGLAPVLGFLFAGLGVWLISRSEDGAGRPEGLGWAVVAGLGFAGFYLCVRQAGQESALWIATLSRTASLALTGAICVVSRQAQRVPKPVLPLALFAGVLDISGTVMFTRASQAGRLDSAVVLSSLYPAVTVLLAYLLLKEHFSRWKTVGVLAALLAVPMIALQ